MIRLLVLLLIASAVGAQTNEDLQRELDDLRKVVEQQARELQAQKTQADKQSEELGHIKSTQLESDIENYLDAAQGLQSDAKPRAGYDGRFFIQTPDGNYRLMFRWYSQFRYNWNQREKEVLVDESVQTQGFEVSRTRIWFDGDLTQHFYFHFRLNIDSQSNVKLVNAYVRWKAPKGWNIDIGERWFYLSREDWTLPMDQLTTEFSANDLVFAIGTSRGVQVNKNHKYFRYYFAISDGPFSGGQNFTAATTDYTLTGRFEYQFATDQWGIWDDLVGRRGRPFGIMLGIGLGYADGKNGGASAINSATLLTVDFNINWDGGQAIIYATWRFTDPQAGESFYNWGLVAQGGHFITERQQLYARYELVSPGDQPGDEIDYNSITVGYNFFPFVETNVMKFSVEFSYLFDALSQTIVPASTGVGFLPASEGAQWYFRLQAQFGF